MDFFVGRLASLTREVTAHADIFNASGSRVPPSPETFRDLFNGPVPQILKEVVLRQHVWAQFAFWSVILLLHLMFSTLQTHEFWFLSCEVPP